ncbi:MAG TPA: sigma-70 family RNA polymerase sigma factor [Opitutales bacterium]|jgi:RNA polymerase sigma factor (sigma-70 family)|nr:sigma-70 family RNA polymerase sigma factor [Opitutales bacterium]
MITDGALLRKYARSGDEAAFAEVVHRHMNMVYSVAARATNGDAPAAQDAAQRVFADLARKAPVLWRHEALAGWLHTSARFAARDISNQQRRRRQREHEASVMHNITSTLAENWDAVKPILDEAVGELNARDRDAVVLRFYQQKSHREIGEALGLSENTTRMRVERALEKLREHFSRRGVTTSGTLLAEVIAARAVEAAPAGLESNATGAAVTAGVGSSAYPFFLKYLLTMNTFSQIAALAVAGVLIAVPLVHVSAKPAPALKPSPMVLAASSNNDNAGSVNAGSTTPQITAAPQTTPTNSVVSSDVPPASVGNSSYAQVRGATTSSLASPKVVAPGTPSQSAATRKLLASSTATASSTPRAMAVPPVNVRVHASGVLYDGYPIDVTLTGVGRIQQSFYASPASDIVGMVDSVPETISVTVTQGENGYQVTFNALIRLPGLDSTSGDLTYRAIQCNGDKLMNAGDSAVGVMSQGDGKVTFTLSN